LPDRQNANVSAKSSQDLVLSVYKNMQSIIHQTCSQSTVHTLECTILTVALIRFFCDIHY